VSSASSLLAPRVKLDHREQPEHEELRMNGSGVHRSLSTNDLFLKDAFLVFRAMCKLTMKPLNTDRYALSSVFSPSVHE
jgi:hypothetical protein